MMNSYRYRTFQHFFASAFSISNIKLLMRGFFAAGIISVGGYAYLLISSIGLSYQIRQEQIRLDVIAESEHTLENTYARTSDDVRLDGGATLGLVASAKPRFVETFSSVARAGF